MNRRVTTYRLREGYRESGPHLSRSNCAPAYYQARSAELVTYRMNWRPSRTATDHLSAMSGRTG